MIDTVKFYDYLVKNNLNFFTGVPDSLLSNICACITDNSDKTTNIIAANEGNSIALASGYHLASGRFGVVYMQNSGLGNCVNPLLSLADEEVYNIPMLLIIGLRGEPGVKDEPQHVKQGKLTIPLLDTMGIENMILGENYEEQIDYCIKYMKKTNKPIAIVVRKGDFSDYKLTKEPNNYTLTRESALEEIISNLTEDDFIVSTTGKTSREIFEIRERNSQGHANDFLTVGSMGHTASIALGISLESEKDIYCIDGDGSFIMHAGGFGIAAANAKENFKYIMINNGAHESVGGQPTVGFRINPEGILKGFGFNNVYIIKEKTEIADALKKLKTEKLSALIIYTKQGSRDDLGRPTVRPVDNKIALMNKLRGNE